MVPVPLPFFQRRSAARQTEIDPVAIDRDRDEEVPLGGATLIHVVLRLLQLLLRLTHLPLPDPSPLLPQVPDILRRELAPGVRFRVARRLGRRPGGGLLGRRPRDRKRVAARFLELLLRDDRRRVAPFACLSPALPLLLGHFGERLAARSDGTEKAGHEKRDPAFPHGTILLPPDGAAQRPPRSFNTPGNCGILFWPVSVSTYRHRVPLVEDTSE